MDPELLATISPILLSVGGAVAGLLARTTIRQEKSYLNDEDHAWVDRHMKLWSE